MPGFFPMDHDLDEQHQPEKDIDPIDALVHVRAGTRLDRLADRPPERHDDERAGRDFGPGEHQGQAGRLPGQPAQPVINQDRRGDDVLKLLDDQRRLAALRPEGHRDVVHRTEMLSAVEAGRQQGADVECRVVASMRVVEISAPGPPDVLRLAERPVPAPGPGEVLIEVHAAGVNRPDLMQREGRYPPPPGTSDLPGLEVAGRIAAIGPPDDQGEPRSATGRMWRPGDEVCALVAGGGYAEFCVAPGVQCLPLPRGFAFDRAAAIPETYFTVWTNVFDRGRLASGEWLLVHGGTSGIGSTAIQLAAARGARVLATAGSDRKCRAVLDFGAVRAINHRTEDFVAVVAEATGRRGVDVVLDIIGGAYAQRNLDSLARDGRLVQIGVIGGSAAEISLRTIMLRRLTLTGSTLRIRTPAEKGAIAHALEQQVWPLLEAGRVHPVVDRSFPLAEAAAAHRALEAGEVIGKVVLRVR